MKISINCKNQQQIIYDVDKNEFDTELNFDCIKEHKTILKPEDPNKKNINLFQLVLGLKCNFECKYCIQKYNDNKDDIHTDVDRLKQSIKNVYEKCNIRKHIEIWGGEPFVYWKTIKQIIPLLRHYWPYTNIFITTNGSLLNESIINFLINYNICLQISHDGPAQKYYRTKDPLEDPVVYNSILKGIGKGLKVTLHPVLSKYNCNLIDLYRYFDKVLPGMHISVEGIVINSKHNGDNFEFNNQQQQTFIDTFTELILKQTEIYDGIKPVARIVNGYKRQFKSCCSCFSDANLAINVNGDILRCHNDSPNELYDIGNVNNEFDISPESKRSNYYLIDDKPKCLNCWAKTFCAGGCCVTPNNELTEGHCNNRKLGIIASLNAVIKYTYNTEISSINVIQ